MDVYLVQHGQAVSEEQDAARPLSDEGRVTVQKMAGYLAGLAPRLLTTPITQVRHSGKLRARQTGEILAGKLCPHVGLVACSGLNPEDDPRVIYQELEAMRDRPEAWLVVGHLPHLARLAGMLLTGDPNRRPIRFTNAAVLKIVPTPDRWTIEWYLTPACLA